MNEKKLIEFIQETPYLNEVLEKSSELNIPNWYFGAGCLSQSYWNYKFGRPKGNNIKDIDWIYFDDSDLSEESENRIQNKVQNHFKELPFEFDVNNQARVHLWYKEIFGYSIVPYKSSKDAVKTWPTTLTSVALTKNGDNIEIFAPFGLDDFFSLKVRANKVQITEEIYLKKVNRWKKCWPDLTVIPW